jgi:hypothetical protein
MVITWTDNFDAFFRDVARAEREISDAVREGVRDAVQEGAQEARTTHQYKDRTGALTASIEGNVLVSTPGAALGEIRARKRYASFVEEGTPPHEIRPRSGQALRFNVGGRTVFARSVNHPGTKADGFMGRAYQKAERVIEARVDLGVARAKKILEDGS